MRLLFAFLGLLAAAVLDLLVNLIASAIEGNLGARVIDRSLWLLVVLALVGMLAGAWFASRRQAAAPPHGEGVELSSVAALWSRIRTRGGRVRLRRIFSVGSSIDINTRGSDGRADD